MKQVQMYILPPDDGMFRSVELRDAATAEHIGSFPLDVRSDSYTLSEQVASLAHLLRELGIWVTDVAWVQPDEDAGEDFYAGEDWSFWRYACVTRPPDDAS